MEIFGLIGVILIIIGVAQLLTARNEKKQYGERADGSIYLEGRDKWKGSVRGSFGLDPSE